MHCFWKLRRGMVLPRIKNHIMNVYLQQEITQQNDSILSFAMGKWFPQPFWLCQKVPQFTITVPHHRRIESSCLRTHYSGKWYSLVKNLDVSGMIFLALLQKERRSDIVFKEYLILNPNFEALYGIGRQKRFLWVTKQNFCSIKFSEPSKNSQRNIDPTISKTAQKDYLSMRRKRLSFHTTHSRRFNGLLFFGVFYFFIWF